MSEAVRTAVIVAKPRGRFVVSAQPDNGPAERRVAYMQPPFVPVVVAGHRRHDMVVRMWLAGRPGLPLRVANVA